MCHRNLLMIFGLFIAVSPTVATSEAQVPNPCDLEYSTCNSAPCLEHGDILFNECDNNPGSSGTIFAAKSMCKQVILWRVYEEFGGTTARRAPERVLCTPLSHTVVTKMCGDRLVAMEENDSCDILISGCGGEAAELCF